MPKSINIKKRGVTVQLDFSFALNNLKQAQATLTNTVLKDTDEFVPFNTGTLAGSPQASPSNLEEGVIIYQGPYARFLYYGRVMIGEKSKRPWARKGEKKIITNTPLKFDRSAHPKATSFWFQRSKAQNGEKWIKITKKVAGGNK